VDEVIKNLADLIKSGLSLQADCDKYIREYGTTEHKLYSFFHMNLLSPRNIRDIKLDLAIILKNLKELQNVIQYVKDLIYTTTTVQTGNMEKVEVVLKDRHFGLFPKSVQENVRKMFDKIDNLHNPWVDLKNKDLKNKERIGTGVSARYKVYTTLKRVPTVVKNPGNENNPGNISLAHANNSRTLQKIKQKVREI
jgi:hypothetical protein